jgi:hypothetical protein
MNETITISAAPFIAAAILMRVKTNPCLTLRPLEVGFHGLRSVSF